MIPVALQAGWTGQAGVTIYLLVVWKWCIDRESQGELPGQTLEKDVGDLPGWRDWIWHQVISISDEENSKK